MDYLLRLGSDASMERVFAHFPKNVEISFDPTEGVLRLKLTALSPGMSWIFSEALIRYAEDRIDRISDRKQTDNLQGARKYARETENKLLNARQRVLELQEAMGVIDPVKEASSVLEQVQRFEIELAERRL